MHSGVRRTFLEDTVGGLCWSPDLGLTLPRAPETFTHYSHTSRRVPLPERAAGETIRYCFQTLSTSPYSLALRSHSEREGQLCGGVKRHVFVLKWGKKARSKQHRRDFCLCTGDCLRGPVYAYLIEEWAAVIQRTGSPSGQVEQGG